MVQPSFGQLHSSSLALNLPDWLTRSLEAVRNSAAAKSCRISNDKVSASDCAIFTMLKAFALQDTPSDLELLRKGASLRKRWNRDGDIVERDATYCYVDPTISNFLLDDSRYEDAQNWYQSTNFGSRLYGPAGPSSSAAEAFRRNLPADLKLFWSYVTMILVCRAVPWKSLQRVLIDYRELTRRLYHALEGYTGGVNQIPNDARMEIASSLVEASRLPYPKWGLKWRAYAIDKADEMVHDLEEEYQHIHIAQARSQLNRIRQDHTAAIHVLDTPSTTTNHEPPTSVAICNAARGQIAIQHSLNCLQNDDPGQAIKSLETWIPGPTAMETAVSFHARLLHAKSLRYKGDFTDAYGKLSELFQLQDKSSNLEFEEYRRDWTYEMAAILIEQDRPEEAEQCISKELDRRELHGITYPSAVPLRLLLAESLFTQGEGNAAEIVCGALEPQCRLIFDRLHRQIILAKSYHMKFMAVINIDGVVSDEPHSSWSRAREHWLEAVKLITQKTMNEGHSTLVLHLSLFDLLSYSQAAAWQNLKKQTENILRNARLGRTDQTVKYWIPGLMAWKEKLSRGRAPVESRPSLEQFCL